MVAGRRAYSERRLLRLSERMAGRPSETALSGMRKYIDNDDSWTYHRDYAISEAVSEYKEDKNNA